MQQNASETRASPLSQAPASAQPPPDTSSIIAHSPQATRRPSTAAYSSAAPTNVSSRRAVCTHMSLMRIYGPYKCHHCGRVPRLGWVYRCVQDFGDDLVGFNHRDDDDFASALERRLAQESVGGVGLVSIQETSDHVSAPSSPHEPLVSAPALKPWMQKLADENFYTQEQIVNIKAQRQKVLDCIAVSGCPHEPTKSELKDAAISDPSILTTSSNYLRRGRRASMYGAPTLRSYTIAPYWQTHVLLDEGSVNQLSADALDSRPALRFKIPAAVNICTYQTCSTCRPGTRDRTWQCMHHEHYSAARDHFQLPTPNTDNRLLSNPSLVISAYQKILHPDPAPYDDDSHLLDEETYYDDESGSGYDSSEISPDISSGVSLEGTPTSAQFDENRGWDQASNSTSAWPHGPAAARPLRRASSMDPRLLRSSRDIENMDLNIRPAGLGISSPANADMVAVGTTAQAIPEADRNAVLDNWFVRPGAEAALGFRSDAYALSVDQQVSRKPSGEVAVEDGIAVTEEAVAAGDPDVIVHA